MSMEYRITTTAVDPKVMLILDPPDKRVWELQSWQISPNNVICVLWKYVEPE
jgi:hypothetical protein